MNTKHTPGPWDVILKPPRRGFSLSAAVVVEHRANKVATVWNHPLGDGQANARLIAAAPLMLAALQEIAHHSALQDRSHLRKLADAAIARATGGTP